jgi:recombination associated protein RdgC
MMNKECQYEIYCCKMRISLYSMLSDTTWQGRVSFVLTEALQLKKIIFQEPVQSEGQDEGGLDADTAIATGELGKLIRDLAAALGGDARGGNA